MKVLLLTHTYPTHSAPWTTPFIANFGQALADQPGVDVHVVLPTADRFIGSGLTFHPFPYRGQISHKGIGKAPDAVGRLDQLKFLVAGLQKVIEVCRGENIDLVHAHWSIPSGLIARLNQLCTGTPYVVTTHGRDVLNCPEVGYTVPSEPLLGRAVRRVLQAACGVIVTSPITEESTRRLAPKAKTFRIPVGLNEEFVLGGEEIPGREGIVFVGDFVPLKGIDRLIKTVSRSPKLRSTPVTIIGDGPERATYERLCGEQGLNNIKFIGFVSPDRIRSYMEAAKAFAFVSHIEAFGIVLLEALAAGLMLVGSSTGALPDLRQLPALSNRIIEVPGDGEIFLRGLQQGLEQSLESYSPLPEEAKRVLLEQYTWPSIARSHVGYFQRICHDQKPS